MIAARFAFTLPLRIYSTLNLREHWAARARRNKHHRTLACFVVRRFLDGTDGRCFDKIAVTMTRLAPRQLDYDGLVSGLKAVVDGIAEALEVDDGSERYAWAYKQEKAKEYGVRVEIDMSGGA